MLIVHLLPFNPEPCGGVKVHIQMAELEIELGHRAYVALPEGLNQAPDWLAKNPQVRIIDYNYAKSLLTGREGVLIGWENPQILDQFPARKKIVYVQGFVFYKSSDPYGDKIIWYSSNYNKSIVGIPGPVVPPFVDRTVFYPLESFADKFSKPYSILVQSRKDGSKKWEEVARNLNESTIKSFSPIVLTNKREEDFATSMRQATMFFAHSFPEGFGLPALEAMVSGTLVFGYTGGGGSDFMTHRHNSFIAPNGDFFSVSKMLEGMSTLSYDHLIRIVKNAFETASQYSKENTKSQLQIAIDSLMGIHRRGDEKESK